MFCCWLLVAVLSSWMTIHMHTLLGLQRFTFNHRNILSVTHLFTVLISAESKHWNYVDGVLTKTTHHFPSLKGWTPFLPCCVCPAQIKWLALSGLRVKVTMREQLPFPYLPSNCDVPFKCWRLLPCSPITKVNTWLQSYSATGALSCKEWNSLESLRFIPCN